MERHHHDPKELEKSSSRTNVNPGLMEAQRKEL